MYYNWAAGSGGTFAGLYRANRGFQFAGFGNGRLIFQPETSCHRGRFGRKLALGSLGDTPLHARSSRIEFV